MTNQIILVGRLQSIKDNQIKIRVSRYYKNQNGEYEDDLIPVEFYNIDILKDLKKDSVLGIKGRIESHKDKSIMIIAEKVTFLSSDKEKENK